ncbi:MAG: heme b synthase [Deltaproteobacteria bacterium]|nr:heme b synthase [Deltaproteobacteria bacterium]
MMNKTSHHPGHPAGKPGGYGHSDCGPRMIAWEVTRRCNLACSHCRASAKDIPYQNELSTAESRGLIDEMVKSGNPVVILTGGEPLLRDDIFELAAYGTEKGLRMVMAPNGTLITPERAKEMLRAGIHRISISLDGATKESHDNFRQVPGAFDGALRGMAEARAAGVEFQVNTTVTMENLAELPAIQDLAVRLGAAAHHVFMLVPTGRAKDVKVSGISAEEYEKILNWLYDRRKVVPIHIKVTCGPHYYRVMRQRAAQDGEPVDINTFGLDAVTRGCLGGVAFCFISHVGRVQPCGYLDLTCGDVREQPFSHIWRQSEIFNTLRDYGRLEGKCGRCEFKRVCGGCRARAHEMSGNYLAEEPLCGYQPKTGGDHA